MDAQPLNFVNKCAFIVKIISVILICTNLAVLLGWLYHISFLTSVSSTWVSMKVNTAICFILSGFALLLLSNNTSLYARVITLIFTMIILLIGGMTVFEFIFGLDFGIDQLFFKDTFNSVVQHPGRMALVTALNFIFVSFAFLFTQFRWQLSAQNFALLVFFIGLFSLYNYVFDVNLNFSIAIYTTMALHTSLLFILLSFGILLIKPDIGIVKITFQNTAGSYYLRCLLPIILFVPVLIGLIENKLGKEGLIQGNLGDSIIAAGTFIALGIMITIIVRRMDQEEQKLLSANIQIQQSEIIFYQFLENIDIVFYKTSPDLSQILYASPAYEKVWGRSTDTLYKNPKEWFDSILPEDQKKVYEEFFEGMQQGKTKAYAEFRIKKPDGSIRNILSRGFLLKDQNNIPFCITGIAVDMTDLKQVEKYLHNREDIEEIIENEKTINAAGPKIIKKICQMYNWDLGEIWLIDETKNILRFVNNWHIESKKINEYNKESRQHTFIFGEGLPGMIWQEKGPIWIPDYSKRREFSLSFDAEKAGLNSAFGMPIIFQDQVFGIIEFFSHKIQTPDDAMLAQMNNIGKLLGEFINRVHTNDQIQLLARLDILTGLLNRSAFEEELNKIIKDIELDIIAVVIVDLDKFKLANDALGNEQGDAIIKLAANKLKELIDLDQTPLARLGADKFILFYSKIKNAEDIVDYANQIQRSFKEPFIINGKEIIFNVSIGISVYPQDGITTKTLISSADQALNYAKRNGGNKTQFFTKELPTIALAKLAMHIDLHQAITKNQFFLNYQPQVNLRTGKICGAEALVRWKHLIKGWISPAEFISYAEQTGLIISLNEHIMRMAFQQVKAGWSGPPISINISAQQFKNKYHLVEYIESLMKEFSVDPKHIEFEITENVLMEEAQHNTAILGALRQMGFQFAIDDFGTGFSSFSYLYRIPAHKIKIDQSFIRGLPENQTNAEIVKSMIAMFHSLGKIIVAEGAETVAEVEYLKNEKCDIVQGYYFYKPLPADEFVALIAKS